jgi:putative DNA primase/helicase
MNAAEELGKVMLGEDADHEGHALCVLQLYPDTFVNNQSHGWMFYNGGFWEREGAQAAVERAVTQTLKVRRQIGADQDHQRLVNHSWANRHNVNGVREQIKKEKAVQVSIDAFDAEPDFINCANGAVDLRTGEIHKHNPLQRFTYRIDVSYDPGAESDLWMSFLNDTLCSDQELIDYLQMAVGYSLTGRTNEEIMFYIYGPPRSGKGTFTETLIALLGWPLATEVDFETFTANRYGDTQNFDLAPLKPCRFVAASESNRYGSLNPAKIKQLTGGNYIRCAFKRQDHFSYRPQYKIWLSSNHPVSVDVDDDAAWSRVRVIEFPVSRLGHENKKLKEQLLTRASMQGVLAWAVQGAIRWYANADGLPLPKKVETYTQKHRDELDYIQIFLDECCELPSASEQMSVPGSVLYQAYFDWCKEEGYKAKGRRQFSMSLAAKGIESKPKKEAGHVARYFFGVRLKASGFAKGNGNEW